MDFPSPVLFIVLGVLLVVGIGILAWWQAEKRRKALVAWAEANGFRFDPARDKTMERRYPLHKVLRKGSNRYAQNVMDGARGERDVRCFDYHYETYSTNSKGQRQTHHHHFSAAVVDSGLPLKALTMRPEHIFDRIAEVAGFDDIDFESAEFSKKFHVKAPDRKWAFHVLHGRTITFLLEQPRFTVEMAGPWVMARRSGRFRPEVFAEALGVVEGILDRLPRYLLEELKGEKA